jgi:putative ABC transport system substrate-binding protein
LEGLAYELARSKVDILAGIGGDVAVALRKATKTIPIVVAMSTDPVRSQLASSLARPGGNLTGITFLFDELAAKRVELFREMLPNGSRLAVLWDPSHVDNDFTEVQTAARRQNIKLQSLELHGPVDLDTTIQEAAKGHPETLIVVPSRLTAFLGKRIVDVATRQRVPVISGWREFAQDGAVMTYGPNRIESAKRLAIYIDKIVKGAKPADLPIEQPTTFELVINLKTAKALGLTLPPSLLLRADQVIE